MGSTITEASERAVIARFESGFAALAVADITTRAGVARSASVRQFPVRRYRNGAFS
jgi:AcrR family transcriptional regulator